MAARAERHVGRPAKAEAYREVLVQALTEDVGLRTVELLHRARVAGYTGGKTALYALAHALRGRVVTPLVRFEGLAGEFSQHDFGEVEVRYQDDDPVRRRRVVSSTAKRPKLPTASSVTFEPDDDWV